VDDLELRTATGPDIAAGDLYAALRLRAEVFVVEQACVYLDPDGRDLEPTTVHLWLSALDGKMASYVRVLAEPGGGHRIGRVVTDPDHRAQGLAARLLQEALLRCERPVVLHAQSHLVAVYGRHGFVPDGTELLDDGIPHTPMRLA